MHKIRPYKRLLVYDVQLLIINFSSFNTNNANQVNIMPPGKKKRRRRKRYSRIYDNSKINPSIPGIRNVVATKMILEAIKVYVVQC